MKSSSIRSVTKWTTKEYQAKNFTGLSWRMSEDINLRGLRQSSEIE